MKLKTLSFLGMMILGTLILNSCKDNESPVNKIIGSYTGSFVGNWQGNDTLITTAQAFTVTLAEVSDNKVLVSGSLFNDFEVLVTNNGINVEPVADSPELPQFLYSGDSKELDFNYNEGTNTAAFIGVKNE